MVCRLSQNKSKKVMTPMPLNRKVAFKRPLEACNKVQVPKIIRWEFKLEPDQVLRVSLSGLGGGCQFFYARMGKDGRIFIPKAVLFAAHGKIEKPTGYLLDISIEPA